MTSATLIFSLILFILLIATIGGVIYFSTQYKHEKSSKWGKNSKKHKLSKGKGKG